MGDRQHWRGSAACAGLGLQFSKPEQDFFFILPGQKSKRAKTFCGECPVRKRCLEYALIYGEYGIWGGTTEEERREFPDYLKESLRKREAETVGLESRNIDDFIPRQYQTTLQVTHQVTVVETQSFSVTLAYGSESAGEPLVIQLEVLDRLFAQTNDLLESFL